MSGRKKQRKGRAWLRWGLIVVELLVLALLVGTAWMFYTNAKRKQSAAEFTWDDYQTVIHSLGGLDDKVYLNSKEGFEYYYEKGERLFEVDLTKTADGVWVCRHDWEDSKGQWEGDGKKVLMADAFKSTPLYEAYTPLTLEDLFKLLRKYPDAYVLFDCKDYSSRDYENTLADYKAYAEIARAAGDEALLNQVIPELYNQKMYKATEKVYHFPTYIYSLWQEYSTKQLKKIAAYCKETGIPAVSISSKYWSKEIQALFDEQEIKVYIYTVNDAKKAKKYLKKGAAGICTDTLLKEDFTGK